MTSLGRELGESGAWRGRRWRVIFSGNSLCDSWELIVGEGHKWVCENRKTKGNESDDPGGLLLHCTFVMLLRFRSPSGMHRLRPPGF